MGPKSKKRHFSTVILRGQYGHSHGPQQRPCTILAGMGLNFFGTLPDSVSSAPEIFRPLTLFLWEGRGTEVKKNNHFSTVILRG